MKIKRTIIVLAVVLSFLLVSCATIFKGPYNNVNFTSEPMGAEVYVNGKLLGKTPVKLELLSKNSYVIEFVKEGFEKKKVNLHNSVGGGWIVLDVLGGLLPIVIDAATGSWYELNEEHVSAILKE